MRGFVDGLKGVELPWRAKPEGPLRESEPILGRAEGPEIEPVLIV